MANSEFGNTDNKSNTPIISNTNSNTSLFGNTTKQSLFDNSNKDSNTSLFGNSNTGVSAPSIFGKNDTKITFNTDKKEEKKEDNKKDESSLFGIPKEKSLYEN